MKQIEFNSEDFIIRGTISESLVSANSHPAVLFLHGWMSQQNRYFIYMDELAKLGFTCMTFDMRGHGSSEGQLISFSREDFLNDCILAYDYLANVNNIDKTNMHVVGSSFGGYLGSILTSKRSVKSLVLRVPADYPNKGFNESKLEQDRNEEVIGWRSMPHAPEESFALDALHKFSGDILLVESEKDEIIKPQTIKNFANAVADKSKLTHIVMKNAPHAINHIDTFKSEFKNILVQWFGTRK